MASRNSLSIAKIPPVWWANGRRTISDFCNAEGESQTGPGRDRLRNPRPAAFLRVGGGTGIGPERSAAIGDTDKAQAKRDRPCLCSRLALGLAVLAALAALAALAQVGLHALRAPETIGPLRWRKPRADATRTNDPHVRTYCRPLVRRLRPEDPIEVALHWAGATLGLPGNPPGGLRCDLDALRSFTFTVWGPDGTPHELRLADRPRPHASRRSPPDASMPKQFHPASYFLTLQPDGVVWWDPHNGDRFVPWAEGRRIDLGEIGPYRVRIDGRIRRSDKPALRFRTGKVGLEITREIDRSLAAADQAARAAVPLPIEKTRVPLVQSAEGDLIARYVGKACPGKPPNPRMPWSEGRFAVRLSRNGRVLDVGCNTVSTCLVAGTRVATPAGPVPIEDLAPGDPVWAWNRRRQTKVATPVRGIRRGTAREWIELTERLRATPGHPVLTNGGWRPAWAVQRGDLTHLHMLPDLVELRIGGEARVGPAALRHIARLRSLRKLALRYAPWDTGGLEALAKLERLRSLSLTRAGPGRVRVEDLLELPRLRRLRLRGIRLTPEQIERLANHPGLQSLKVIGPRYEDAALSAFAEMHNLKRLGVGGPLTDDGILALTSLENLDALSLYETRVTKAGAQALKARVPSLERILRFEDGKADPE